LAICVSSKEKDNIRDKGRKVNLLKAAVFVPISMREAGFFTVPDTESTFHPAGRRSQFISAVVYCYMSFYNKLSLRA
jgi:hypothetical protein